jgi:hypothetical protein
MLAQAVIKACLVSQSSKQAIPCVLSFLLGGSDYGRIR